MNPFRVDIVNLLNLIADYKSQIEYQEAVPYVGVPDEMVCQWFDDLYHPDAEIFQSAFFEEEQQRLAEFNRTFDRYADNLPQTIELLHRSNDWRVISNEARNICNDLGWLKLELNYFSK